jgi:hypothetical protein
MLRVMKRKGVFVAIGGLAVLAVGTSVAIASAGTTRSASRLASTMVLGYKHTARQAAADRAAAARSYMRQARNSKVDRALVKDFGVLRVARRASASTEATVAAAISNLAALGASRGADPSQAGETSVGPNDDGVWLVPGTSGACLVDVEGSQGAGSNCASASAVESGDLWTLDTIPYGAGGIMTKVLLGAVPDGNASVTVAWADGGTSVVPVRDNIYCVPIGSHTGWKSVTLTNSAGTAVNASGMANLP